MNLINLLKKVLLSSSQSGYVFLVMLVTGSYLFTDKIALAERKEANSSQEVAIKTPGKLFPKIENLVFIGEGKLDSIDYPNIDLSSTLVGVYISKIRKQQPVDNWVYTKTADSHVYLLDAKSNCLSVFDQKKRMSGYRQKAFELNHESINNCQQRSNLAPVNIIEIYRCRSRGCKQPLNLPIMLKGERDVFSDDIFFRGELPIPPMFPMLH